MLGETLRNYEAVAVHGQWRYFVIIRFGTVSVCIFSGNC